MASCTIDSIEERIRLSGSIRNDDLLPICPHNAMVETDLGRLATFANIDSSFCGSAVRLAGSGCIYNADERYIECIYGGKITPILNGYGSMRLCDLANYHHPTCIKYRHYIKRKHMELNTDYIQRNNLRRLRRFRHKDTGNAHDDEDPCGLVTLNAFLDLKYDENNIIKSTVKLFFENGKFPGIGAMLDKMEETGRTDG